MKYLLICPGTRTDIGFPDETPPPVVPMLGQTLVEYWLSHLSLTGIREITVLASSAVPEVEAIVGTGERWGLKACVKAEARELTAAQVSMKYTQAGDDSEDSVVLMDHFPGFPAINLFETHLGFYKGLSNWIPYANTPDRVGFREVKPGIWVGRHASVSSSATLESPCWIGRHTRIEAHATIGAGTIIEDGAVIDYAAEIHHSHVGPRTYIGKFGSVHDSLAWGNTLLNWASGSTVKVPDPFVMCALRRARTGNAGMFRKLSQAYAENKLDAQFLWKQLLMHREG